MKKDGYYWQYIPDGDEESLIKKINSLSKVALFDLKGSLLEIADLCFYKNFKLLKATTFNTIPPVTMQYLVGGSAPEWTVIKLDGTREPIFENNLQAGLTLNEETIIEYARFVLGAVMSEDGSLRLVEAVDEDTFTADPTPTQREEITRFIRPAKVKKTGDGFELDVIILYGANVYRADVSVLSDGFTEIKNEELLAEDMPIRPIFLE